MSKLVKHTDRKKAWNRRKIKTQPYQIEVRNPKKTAYSNDAFELWFILHYQFIDGKLHRDQYYQILSDRWNCNYSKKGKSVSFCHKIFDLLDEDPDANMENAILYADRLFQDQKHLTFCDQNPCTLVYKLVQELNQYL